MKTKIILFIVFCVMVAGSNPATAQKKAEALALATEIAYSFSKAVPQNYAYKVLQYRTVEQSGKYVEFNAYQGVIAAFDYKQSASKSSFNTYHYEAPLTVMRSNAYDDKGKELEYDSYLVYDALSTFDQKRNMAYERAAVDYHNHPSFAYNISRCLDHHSPLNLEVIDCFDYSLGKPSQNEKGEELMELKFVTRMGTFPLKVRLDARGVILYNVSLKQVEKVTINPGYVNYYTIYSGRNQAPDFLCTSERLEVAYQYVSGKVYPKSVMLTNQWTARPTTGFKEGYISPTRAVRVEPLDSRLKTYERIEISNPVELEPQQKQLIYRMQPASSYMDRSFVVYCAPYVESQWKDVVFQGVNWPKLQKDIRIADQSLEQQIQKNGLKGYFNQYTYEKGAHSIQEDTELLRELYKTAWEQIYPAIYGTVYAEE